MKDHAPLLEFAPGFETVGARYHLFAHDQQRKVVFTVYVDDFKHEFCKHDSRPIRDIFQEMLPAVRTACERIYLGDRTSLLSGLPIKVPAAAFKPTEAD